jgi:hypothetical protein
VGSQRAEGPRGQGHSGVSDTEEPLPAPPVLAEETPQEYYEAPYADEPAHYQGTVPAPVCREDMIFTNRFNYAHYYRVPANVGLQNVPSMVSEMMRLGCRLGDIQITFEVEELK